MILYESVVAILTLLMGLENISLHDRELRFKSTNFFVRISLLSGNLLMQSLCMVMKCPTSCCLLNTHTHTCY